MIACEGDRTGPAPPAVNERDGEMETGEIDRCCQSCRTTPYYEAVLQIAGYVGRRTTQGR